MPDFGQGTTVLFDAYWRREGLRPRSRSASASSSRRSDLERLQSATDIVFAERGLPTNLVPNRDIGLQLGGRHLQRRAHLRGRGLQRRRRSRQRRRRRERRQGLRRPRLPPAVQARLAQGPGLRRRGHAPASSRAASGTAAELGAAGYRTPGQQTFFRYRVRRHDAANTVFADGRAAAWRRRATSTAARSACRASTSSRVRK